MRDPSENEHLSLKQPVGNMLDVNLAGRERMRSTNTSKNYRTFIQPVESRKPVRGLMCFGNREESRVVKEA